jgi:hypothetical protein
MEQILDSLDIAWVRAQEPLQDVTCEVIYLSVYICFTLEKINNSTLVGDVYRLTLPPYQNTDYEYEINMFINKLAYYGLKFMLDTNEIHIVTTDSNRDRIIEEMNPTFIRNDGYQYYEYPDILDCYIFDMCTDFINNFDTYDHVKLIEEILYMNSYFAYWKGDIDQSSFSIGNRWFNIGMLLLSIAERNRDNPISAVIMYAITSIMSRFGETAGIDFVQKAKEIAIQNTCNDLLKIWNNKLIKIIQHHNRIFYEI